MNKKDILKILESAKDKNGDVPMRLVRQAFEKLPIECEDAVSRAELLSAFPYDDEPTVTKCSLRMTINHLPPVTPKRKAMICGACSHSDSKTLYTTNPPKIQCMKTGNLHFTTDYCDCNEINVEEQKNVHDVIN